MADYEIDRKTCTVCGCWCNTDQGTPDLHNSISSNITNEPFVTRAAYDKVTIHFDRDLDPQELAYLYQVVTAWSPPEYCGWRHFPP